MYCLLDIVTLFIMECMNYYVGSILEPSAPQNLILGSVTNSSITINWEAPEDLGGCKLKKYIILSKDTKGKKYKKAGKTTSEELQFEISTNVEAGKSYLIQVKSTHT